MKIADNHKNSMLVCLDKAHKLLIVGITPRFSCGMHNFLIVKYLRLFCELINNVLRRFYAVFGAKCKITDARSIISTFVVSLRCAFVCSCASIALYLGKPFTMVCLSDGNNSIMYHNTELSGDTKAYFDRLYASVSFMYGSLSDALFGNCLSCDSNY